MTRREVLRWLDTRRPAPPAVLRAHLEAAVTDRAEPLPDHLAALGGALLARVVATPAGGRGLAPHLPAPAAFVTHPFAAPAEAGAAPPAPPAARGAGGGAVGGARPTRAPAGAGPRGPA